MSMDKEPKTVEEPKEKPKEKPKAKPYDPNELIDYMAPILPGNFNKDIFVGVNGETCRIKRGEQVKIKRKFLSALNNAQKQQYQAYILMGKMQKKASE